MRKCSVYNVNWKKYIMKPYLKYNLNFIIILFIILKCAIFIHFIHCMHRRLKIQQDVVYVIIFINHILYIQ